MKNLVFGLISVTAIVFAMSLSSCASGGHHGHKHDCCAEGKKGGDGCDHDKKDKGCCDHGKKDGCEVKDEKKP